MSVIQWNCRGYKGNFEDLKTLLKDLDGPQCICLQETFHGNEPLRAPSKYSIVTAPSVVTHTPGTRPSRGVATLIKEDVPFRKLNLTTNLEALAIKIEIGRQYTICNVYITPTEMITAQQLINLTDQLPRPYILVGDLNARSELWGDTVKNTHGSQIEEFISRSEACLLNTGEATHLHKQTGTLSCIDLTFSSPEIINDFSWEVIPDTYNSDHYPIKISKITDITMNENPNISFNVKKADWEKYRNSTIIPNSYFDNSANINELVEKCNSLIHNAAIFSIPLKKKSNKYPVAWWNRDCAITQRERKKAQRKYRRTKSTVDKIALNRASAMARRTKRKSSTQSWVDYISSINSETPHSKHWAKIQKIAGKYRGHKAICLEENNQLITDTQEVADTLANHFSEISSSNFYPTRFNDLRIRKESQPINFSSLNNEPYNQRISKQELTQALKNATDKAPGEDGIVYSMIRNLSQSAQKFILFIFNKIFSANVFPDAWRRSILIPIPKPNKPKTSKSSYRPISLTSALCKLLERIVNNRLVYTLETNNFFSHYQYGFRKARSTIDPLTKIQSDIYQAFKNKEHLIAVFFDIQRAYDTAWRYHILETIYKANLRGHLANFIRNFLENRSFIVKNLNTLSTPFQLEQGVPQGSVLSVTLFGIAINGIVQEIQPEVQKSLFVDDLAIYFSSSSITTVVRQVQLAVNKIVHFTNQTGFKISEEKTVAVHFHRKRGLQQEPHITIENTQIQFAPEAKFLGMVLDSRLNWKKHIEQLKTKCLKSLTLLKCLSKQSWGADRKSMLKIYRATTRAQLDYGCEVYASAPRSYLKKLNAIHHQAIRLCTGAFRSSPTPSLLTEAGEPPLENRREELIIKLFIRQQRLPTNPATVTANNLNPEGFEDDRHSKPFGVMAKNLLRKISVNPPPILPLHNRKFPPWMISDLSIHLTCSFKLTERKQNYHPLDLRNRFGDHLNNDHSESVCIFTDGSKTDSGVGFGVHSVGWTLSKRIQDHASIYTAELQAISHALEKIQDNPNPRFTILSDSLSCIQGIQNMYTQHPIVSKIQDQLVELYTKQKLIKFCWIPSHVGITGNEEADRLAKMSISLPEISLHQIPTTDFKPTIKTEVRKQWERDWSSIPPTQNKLRAIKETTKDWNPCYPGRRRLEIIMTRLRIGHTRLTHGYLMERRRTNECEYCTDIPNTVEHILCECPQYNLARLTHFRRTSPSLPDILGEHCQTQAIISFLTDTQTIQNI